MPLCQAVSAFTPGAALTASAAFAASAPAPTQPKAAGGAGASEALPDDLFPDLEDEGPLVADPIEKWNRAIFVFNDALVEYVARPAYKGYETVTPKIMRTGIKNFFHNAAFPVRFVNNVLQGRGRAAGVEMSRFILNTTAGLGGFVDVAKHHKPIVPVEDEDFGQTLGVWGVGEGFYIVWPFFGPSSARDSVGRVADYFLHPEAYVEPWSVSLGISAISLFNDLDDVINVYDTLKESAIEPYTSARDAYIQYRREKVKK